MAGVDFSIGLGVGQDPTTNAMYGSLGQKGKAGPDVITGELLALVVLELVLLGVIRFSFKHHFGG